MRTLEKGKSRATKIYCILQIYNRFQIQKFKIEIKVIKKWETNNLNKKLSILFSLQYFIQ